MTNAPHSSPDDSVAEELTAHDLAFRARALAQAHALTEPAAHYRAWRVGQDASEYPFAELSVWAATAFLTGYCVRCVEESFSPDPGSKPSSVPPPVESAGAHAAWEADAASFVNRLPTSPGSTLAPHQLVLAALDDVIRKEIDKRTEHVKEQVHSAQWSQFEDFIGWWTLHGYAIRATEK